MIDKSEIMSFARKFHLRASVVEKDYVLGWVLAGIFNHPALGKHWIFKGGTCLKKCHIDTQRFSEDLDFTLTKDGALDKAMLTDVFKEVSAWAYDESGIELPEALIRFDVYDNRRGGISAQGKVGYKGPLMPGGDLPRIKLDLTLDEVLVEPPVRLEVAHPYSDLPPGGISILGYSFEEVFAEKIRALAERERPRDLYDVVCLYRQCSDSCDLNRIREILMQKCRFKNIAFPTMDGLKNRPEQQELEAEWENMLGHQMGDLPEFKKFWQDLEQVMAWLNKDQK